MIRVRSPVSLVPEKSVTPSGDMRSRSTSSPINTVDGFGIFTPFFCRISILFKFMVQLFRWINGLLSSFSKLENDGDYFKFQIIRLKVYSLLFLFYNLMIEYN